MPVDFDKRDPWWDSRFGHLYASMYIIPGAAIAVYPSREVQADLDYFNSRQSWQWCAVRDVEYSIGGPDAVHSLEHQEGILFRSRLIGSAP